MDTQSSSPPQHPKQEPGSGMFWLKVTAALGALLVALVLSAPFLSTPSLLRDSWARAAGIPLNALPSQTPSASAAVDLGSLALQAAASGASNEDLATRMTIPAGYGVTVVTSAPRCVVAFELAGSASGTRSALATWLGLPGDTRSASPGVLDEPTSYGCASQDAAAGPPQVSGWVDADGYHVGLVRGQ